MSKSLFNLFDDVSVKAWKQKIQSDLKGADYNETLIWKSLEGIDVKPFYHSEDFKVLPEVSNAKACDWKICEVVNEDSCLQAKQKALHALSHGAESIRFVFKNKDCDLKTVLEDINLSSTPIYFELQFLSSDFVNKLDAIAKDNNASFYVLTDIIGNLAKTGNWFSNLNDDHKQLEAIVATSNLESVLSVDLSLYQNAGAHSVQQLAYSLAQANEYLNHFNGNIGNHIIFKVSTGGNYFFEIAKIRALRILWDALATEYNSDTKCHIISEPSKRNKTIYDYNVNMLRTTTESMSAVLGGANAISNLAYDAIYHENTEFGNRISRNQLLVLKHESYFNAVNNPSDGSYYIETLTTQFAEKALDLFKHIESNGGLLRMLKEGTLQRKIKESANKELQLFKDGKEVLLGTNKHPNPDDKMKGELEKNPFVEIKVRKTLIEPIIEKRLADDAEQERLKTEC
jgi:methylmalonyl-CoA mutase